ncbi:MAG: lysine--tRNA ligase [Chloroflexi bacterium]|nr:lysine--tRNA ligase [Chloroflexota bacterium]
MGEDEIIALRKTKLERLRSRGVDPYPARFRRTYSAQQAVALLQEGEAPEDAVTVAGRITALRQMGRATFIDLRDGSGRIQTYFKRDVLGGAYDTLQDLDLGDFLGVSGTLFRTRTGEATVQATDFTVLSKALRPPPEKWHGLHDVEVRYRQRYLDLMANAPVRDAFLVRSAAISAIRRFLDGRGFLEVETPVLQAAAGGAAARPFVTYHNALDRQFYLRIALELHLKRLIVGGFDKVYELGRIFRNEGVSTRYNPEFTMLETYEAYADYTDVMAMVEQMISQVAQEVLGATKVTWGDTVIDLRPPWSRVPLRDAIREHSGVDFEAHPDVESMRQAVAACGIPIDEGWGRGKLIDELLSATVQPKLMQPTFLIDYPVELSPLAKRKPDNPGLVERFELFIAGLEVGNAYSELNDPIDQRERFLEQARLRAAGDEEAEVADEDFLVALEHGMPPTAGLGIGIDRLVMALTGHTSIREVILFPALREREQP